MEALKYTFKNNGLEEYNDDVFNRPSFELFGHEYKFKIRPTLKTKFWRFGIALSQTKEFEFSPNNGRYNNKELKYIEIDVGNKKGDEWHSPDLIALGSYYIDGFIGKPKFKRGYNESSEVDVTLKFDSDRDVYASYASKNVSDSEHFPIKEYKYFKIFAWADGIDFEIDCEIRVAILQENKEEKQNVQSSDEHVDNTIKRFNFRNSGEKENNDIISPDIFELVNQSYTFSVFPKTTIWRLGIRLSKSREFEFYDSPPRHRNSNFPDIHIGAGMPVSDNWNWGRFGEFHLVNYFIPHYEHNLDRQDTYKKLGKVEWKLEYNQSKNIISTSYTAEGCNPFSLDFEIGNEYKYFKLFAWADKIEFELEVNVEIFTKQTKSKTTIEDDQYEENVILSNDSISEDDYLMRKPFVNVLADYINRLWKDQRQEAYTINLSGEWGSGKSTILSFLEERLEEVNIIPKKKFFLNWGKKKNGWLIVRYNAWENQHIDPPWWVFMDNIYHGIRKKRKNILARKWIWLQEQWWRTFVVKKFYWISLILFLAATFFLIWQLNLQSIWTAPDTQNNKEEILKPVVALLSILGTLWLIFKGISSSLMPGSSEAALNFQKNIRDPMETLKKHFTKVISYTKKNVAIFVDDIDRCNPESTVKLLEGIQTLFKSPKILYIISGDGAWIRQCFEIKYDKFKSTVEHPGHSLGDFFLEKIFQMNTSVPILSESVIKHFWQILLKGKTGSQKELIKEEEIKLNEARNYLKNKTTEKEINQIIESKKGNENEIYYRQAAVEQISNKEVIDNITHKLEKYVTFLPANPRALKRLINNYALTRQTLILQGISLNDVTTDSLVRWLILNSKFPQFAEKIVKNPSGIENQDYNKVNGFSDLVTNHLSPDIIKSIIGQ